ncbi:chorismate synthase [Kangiella sediminilitoris]|uniref:Chorismate synthase n=1 Tax=Kangiella sediminilitoris TaxID=1144748 RepID=A0A1B3BBC8_9GAMM|nr:chorismate synthase [Kangiella sediminilitoris]AOE50076.1 chorismate synthase [Kangiella sediminilitoris]
MAGDSLGTLFRVTNYGESHGKGIGVVVEGCPAGLALSEEDIQPYLDKRRPGQSSITTRRDEADSVEILSGTIDGKTTGTPISLFIRNKDQRSKDYSEMAQLFRPSHADYTYHKKYGIRDVAGGGRSSARITAGHVAAGAIARKVLHQALGVDIIGYVKSIQDLELTTEPEDINPELIETNLVRCPNESLADKMVTKIEKARKSGDSLGGIVECQLRGVPAGLGEPVFDKLEADLAKAMLAINASKGFEIGSGFAGTLEQGSTHNDIFFDDDGVVRTRSNNSGGVLGGISNGMPIVFRVAFKPTPTIIREQETVNKEGRDVVFHGRGRHDPCVLPRAVPIVEAMSALVLCDHFLRFRAYKELF